MTALFMTGQSPIFGHADCQPRSGRSPTADRANPGGAGGSNRRRHGRARSAHRRRRARRGYCLRLGSLADRSARIGRARRPPRPARRIRRRSPPRAAERALSTEQLFSVAYLAERTALDELALDESIGATSEPWPLVAQLVRRASFDLLAAYTERAQLEPSGAAIIDTLTTLHTRPLFDAVLAKEVDRAGRFGYRDLADPVRRRSPRRDQPGPRLRRRRQDPRAPRHPDPARISGSTTGSRGTRKTRSPCC